MKNIFVYGTLKRGYGNHRLIKDCYFLGELIVKGFKLYESGIPYMKRSDDMNDQVIGEVYHVPEETLRDLDSLEGHPDWYRRESIDSTGRLKGIDDIEGYVYQKGVIPGTESPKVNGVYVYGRERQ